LLTTSAQIDAKNFDGDAHKFGFGITLGWTDYTLPKFAEGVRSHSYQFYSLYFIAIDNAVLIMYSLLNILRITMAWN
jgi:hypothetical protein